MNIQSNKKTTPGARENAFENIKVDNESSQETKKKELKQTEIPNSKLQTIKEEKKANSPQKNPNNQLHHIDYSKILIASHELQQVNTDLQEHLETLKTENTNLKLQNESLTEKAEMKSNYIEKLEGDQTNLRADYNRIMDDYKKLLVLLQKSYYDQYSNPIIQNSD